MNPWDRKSLTPARIVETVVAFLGLLAAFYVNYLAGRFADAQGRAVRPLPDLVLGSLPVLDLRLVFVWGFAAFLVWAFAAGLWFERQRAAHILWLYALLVLVRCFFIILTPMHVPQGAVLPHADPLHQAIGRFINFKHDLFFSAHTAMPFLGFLAHRRPWVAWSFMGFSLLMGATVLLMRLHYSIDVFAAFFITYAVYRFERRWLRRPYRRLRHAVFTALRGRGDAQAAA